MGIVITALTCAMIPIGIAIIIAVVKEEKKEKIYPSGYTIESAKKYLEENSHCGKFWGVKAIYNETDETVYVLMRGNEKVILCLKTGIIQRIDLD